MVLAMAAFACEDTLVKSATQLVPAATVMTGFGLLGMALFAAMAWLRRERVLPAGGLSRGLSIRSAMELCGRLFYSLALAFADLGATSAILQATPLVVVGVLAESQARLKKTLPAGETTRLVVQPVTLRALRREIHAGLQHLRRQSGRPATSG